MNLNLKNGTYRRFMKSGVPISILIPHQAPKQIIKVDIYATGSDTVESKLQTTK